MRLVKLELFYVPNANAQPASHSYGPSPLLHPVGQLAAQLVIETPPIAHVQFCAWSRHTFWQASFVACAPRFVKRMTAVLSRSQARALGLL